MTGAEKWQRLLFIWSTMTLGCRRLHLCFTFYISKEIREATIIQIVSSTPDSASLRQAC